MFRLQCTKKKENKSKKRLGKDHVLKNIKRLNI